MSRKYACLRLFLINLSKFVAALSKATYKSPVLAKIYIVFHPPDLKFSYYKPDLRYISFLEKYGKKAEFMEQKACFSHLISG